MIPMTQRIVRNVKYKRKSLRGLSTDMHKRRAFPNCPSYLSKKKPAERPSLDSSDVRKWISAQILESKRLSEL